MPQDPANRKIDPRAPRFAAAVTAVLLALTLVLYQASPLAAFVLLLVQTAAFASGSLIGLHAQPWGMAFRIWVRSRLDPPDELEDAAPPRFAQGVGVLFGVVGLLGWFLASPAVFYVAVAFALVAALLNAIFDFCLGCELYLLGKRLTSRLAGATG